MISKKIKARSVEDQQELFNELELMGVTDIAREFGWHKGKVPVYVNRGKLPPPMGLVGGRPVWTKKQLENVKR